MFQRKLFFYFFVVFALFTMAVTWLQYNRETELKKESLNNILENYAGIVFNFIEQHALDETGDFMLLDSLDRTIGRDNLRITVIRRDGDILYDNFVDDQAGMENHLGRPEIQEALYAEYGTDIRESVSTGEPHYYFGKLYEDLFVRTAIDYDRDLRSFLRAGRMLFVIILGLFLIMTLLLVYISRRLGKTLDKLKGFALKAASDEPVDTDVDFPANELGVISKQIVLIYDKLRRTKDAVSMEKEKIIRHLYISREGVAIFSAGKEKILSNSLFIQNINFISEKPSLNPVQVFEVPEFREANEFIEEKLQADIALLQTELPSRSFHIQKRGKHFSVHVIIFSDKTFEISINDITALEQEKRIKQQLTSNIAHELRTPVSSITAYLETLISNNGVDDEKREYFINKAYKQAIRLSELINDISVLNRIEESGVGYDNKRIDIKEVVAEINENLRPELEKKKISTNFKISLGVNVKGNYSLVYSIFQNLFENTVRHAGEDVSIHLNNYFEDRDYYYFSYADTGAGVPEKHIGRIFERFYRVDQGRSRKSGGTGLGLAIVKNAVLFHQGDIAVKNREGGGLEFFFSLRKEPSDRKG